MVHAQYLLYHKIINYFPIHRFIILTDSVEAFYGIYNITLKWPFAYRKRLKLEYLPVWYPEERQGLIALWRTCASERVFTPKILEDEDAVIFIDTDVIFMAPPEQLWELFARFDGVQLAAMADMIIWSNKKAEVSNVIRY